MKTNNQNKTYSEVYTWANLLGNPTYHDSLDFDDVYGREALDYKRAERDGWGSNLVWDGK